MAASVGSVLSRMSNLRVVYVTAPSKDVALKIARAAVENKVAACVNIIPSVTSIYEWEGKLHEDSEVVMIFKTQEQRVEELHKVSLLCLIRPFVSIAADAVSSPYAQWVIDQTK
uniref:Divalent-cation tolerance protein CutA n=1 Tax=Angiostrongylus cantonensis TaxID=6313 RepID=A0A0K0CUI0_ANGCA